MGFFPSAALNAQAPRSDTLGAFERLLRFKNQAQERRLNELELEQRGLQLDELRRIAGNNQAMRTAQAAGVRTNVPRYGTEPAPEFAALGNIGGQETEPLFGGQQTVPLPPGIETDQYAMLQSLGQQGRPDLIPGMQAQQAEEDAAQQKALADARKSLLDMGKAEFDLADRAQQRRADAFAAVMSVPEQIRPAMWQMQLSQLVSGGWMTPEEAEQFKDYPGADKMPLFANQFKTEAQLFAEANEARTAKERAADDKRADDAAKLARERFEFEKQQAKTSPSAQPEVINAWVTKLNSGEATMSQVPYAMRNAVIEAQEKTGEVMFTNVQRADIKKLTSMQKLIDDLRELKERVHPPGTGIGAKLSGAYRTVKRWVATDPIVTETESLLAQIATIARGISGEVGVLTNPDIARADTLRPTIFNSAADWEAKISSFQAGIDRGYDTLADTAGVPSSVIMKRAGTGGAPKADQLGIR